MWRYSHARSAREHLEFGYASERSPLVVCFRYFYMALILKIQEFHFGFADMENKEEKRKIYCVSHDICCHHHLACQQLF